jgi:signal peptidase II
MFSPFIHLPLKRALMSTVWLLTPLAFPVQTRYPFLDNLLLLGRGMLQKVKRWVLFIGISGAVLALDRLLSWLVVTHLELGESWDAIPAISQVIRITRSHNTGAAFGMLPIAANLFLVLAFVTVAVFIYMYPRLPDGAWLSRLSIALISGGALGNALDRLSHGYVVDYVHVQLTPTLSNISNIADHLITVGVALLLIDQWRIERRERREVALAAELDAPEDAPDQTGAEDPAAEPNPVSLSD